MIYRLFREKFREIFGVEASEVSARVLAAARAGTGLRWKIGGSTGIRTRNQRLKRTLLYH